MKYVMWLLKAAIFFTLFAFALNNQQVVAVHFFFGTFWKAPLVLVVLATFTCGLSLGVLVMTPRWWRKRRTINPDSLPKKATPDTSGTANPSSENSVVARHGI